MQICEYLKAKEGHAWRPEDTVWVEDKLRQIGEALADYRQAAIGAMEKRWLANAAWNAQARAEWEARNP